MKKYLVETVSLYRIRYVIEAKDEDHAMDEVMMNMDSTNLEEFSQLHIGEQISSVRKLSSKQYLKLFDKDNDYLKSWPKDNKMKFINTIKYND